MNVFKIKETDFLNWYFTCNSVDEIEYTLLQIGRDVRDKLINNGAYAINTKNIFDSINKDIIPIRLVNSESTWANKPEGKLGDLQFQYKVELTNN